MPGGFVVPPDKLMQSAQATSEAIQRSEGPPFAPTTAPQSPLNQVLQQHGVDPISSTTLTAATLRSMLEQAGANVSDPALQAILGNTDVLNSIESDSSILQAFVASMVQKYPRPMPS